MNAQNIVLCVEIQEYKPFHYRNGTLLSLSSLFFLWPMYCGLSLVCEISGVAELKFDFMLYVLFLNAEIQQVFYQWRCKPFSNDKNPNQRKKCIYICFLVVHALNCVHWAIPVPILCFKPLFQTWLLEYQFPNYWKLSTTSIAWPYRWSIG